MLDAKPLIQQLQIAQLLLWMIIAQVPQNLRFWGDAANGKPSDHPLTGKIFLPEDKHPRRPGQKPDALIIET